MSGGLSFSETMAGPVTLGVADPQTGANADAAAELAIHCNITIDDVDRFLADPQHTGAIDGSVDYAPYGSGLPVSRGIFNLFSPGDPGEKLMEYRLAFEHEGEARFLVGRKHVHDDPGFDLWKDTTTLYTVVYEGENESGDVAGAGILSLGVEALARMVATMRPRDDGVEPLVKFGRLFLGALWDTYGATKFEGHTT
jgi:cholesterol oxidase